ncbi:uracil-DNA glycosylase family protein [Peribacillus sp. SCS-155]|uniref:uracil-DNA glycosylase family protein n=1 Tax=Peribacillus sedimenti TaxID=3115297 RepID=UPI0039058567
MHAIIDLHMNFYNSLARENSWIVEELKLEGVSLLTGFVKKVNLVHKFYSAYYKEERERIVLCGINPGRLGAGKTGVPFIDFASLSYLLPGIDTADSELSATFIFSIINKLGYGVFFNKVYLTNISWFGFSKEGRNYNYYRLPNHLQTQFTNGFIKEMEIVKPKTIIPLSKQVEKTINRMQVQNLINPQILIAQALAHPYYYSNFRTRYNRGIKTYIEAIEKYTGCPTLY